MGEAGQNLWFLTDDGWKRWFFGAGGSFHAAPLIRHGFAVPPSPEGEGFGAVELDGCRGKPTLAAGACPRPTKDTFLLPKLLSGNEPGDPQRCGSTARVAGSHCQRPLAARVTPYGVGLLPG